MCDRDVHSRGGALGGAPRLEVREGFLEEGTADSADRKELAKCTDKEPVRVQIPAQAPAS